MLHPALLPSHQMPGWLKSPRSTRDCDQEASYSHPEETSYQGVCSRCLPRCHPCWSVPCSSPTSSQLTHHLLQGKSLCAWAIPLPRAQVTSPGFPEEPVPRALPVLGLQRRSLCSVARSHKPLLGLSIHGSFERRLQLSLLRALLSSGFFRVGSLQGPCWSP